MPEHKRIEDIDLTNAKLKILVYGPWGSGKTWFAGTAPTPHFLCTEEGLIGLRIAGIKGGFTVFKDYDDFLIGLKDVELMKAGVQPYETLVLDGISELFGMTIRQVVKETGKDNSKWSRREWGRNTDLARVAIQQFISIQKVKNCHLIATARAIVKDAPDEPEKRKLSPDPFFGPDVVGQLKVSVPGMFDMVFYSRQEAFMEAGKKVAKFSFHTIEYANFPAKDRTGTLDVVETNDFPTIFKKFCEAKRRLLIAGAK